MNRCLKMLVRVEKWRDSWNKDIQTQAKKYEVEGVMQFDGDKSIKIVACGEDEKLDDFVDYIYELLVSANGEVEELEPFVKGRDYRGIFRVL